jgi:hypothetical protein
MSVLLFNSGGLTIVVNVGTIDQTALLAAMLMPSWYKRFCLGIDAVSYD